MSLRLKSPFARKSAVIEPYTVTVGRNAAGVFGFSINGGIEYDHLPSIQLAPGADLNVIKGNTPSHNDEILSINGAKVPGLMHGEVIGLIKAAGETLEMELVVAPRIRHRVSILASPRVQTPPEDAVLRELVLEGVENAKSKVQTINVVNLKRNAKGKWGFTLEGGSSVGELMRVKAVGDVNVVSSSQGPMEKGQSIIALDGVNIAGADLKQVSMDLADSEAELIELTLLMKESAGLTEILAEDASDPTTQTLKADVQLGLGQKVTTNPDGGDGDFMEPVEFERLQALGKVVAVTIDGGFATGYVRPELPTQASLTRMSLQNQAVPVEVVLRRGPEARALGFSICGAVYNGAPGVYIKKVHPDTLAAEAKLKAGLQVVSVNSTEVNYQDEGAVFDLIKKAGDEIRLGLVVNPTHMNTVKAEQAAAAVETAERSPEDAEAADLADKLVAEDNEAEDKATQSVSTGRAVLFWGSLVAGTLGVGLGALNYLQQ